MNINFRAQPDPLLSLRGSVKPGPSEDKTSSFAYRNNPHPRTVHHMKGLNDVPVCVVRDLGCISGQQLMPRIEQCQSTMRTRALVGHTFPGTTTSNLQTLTSKRNSYPQPSSYDMKENLALRKIRSRNTPILKRKSDLQRKYIPEQPENMSVSDACALPPTLALRHRPEVMEDMNYTATYLDHEIRILEKLHDILQTDSLAEIKEWLSKASLKEKEFVSNFIRSDITARDLLNYQQKYGQSGSEGVLLNLQAMLEGPKAIGTAGEEKQLRNISQGSRGSLATRSDTERENLLTRREKIIIPICEPLLLERPPSRSKIQGRQTPPGIPQTSTHLLYRKCSTRLPQSISGRNIPLKKLGK